MARGWFTNALALFISIALPVVSPLTSSDCAAPDPVRYPLSWTGAESDHNCTEDEMKAFDRSSFSYTCTQINCQMKYGTDNSDQAFGFDDTCRLCYQCADSSSSECTRTTIVDSGDCIDDGSCEPLVDCGPHGSNLGLYACTCDAGYKTDVTSNSYCSVADITGESAVVNTTNTALDESGTEVVAVAIGVTVLVVFVAICVGVLSVKSKHRKDDSYYYPSGRPIHMDAKLISYNRDQFDRNKSELIRQLQKSIDFPKELVQNQQVLEADDYISY